jgi:hypothetical protein
LNDSKIGASDFLALGLYAFAGFGLEIVLSMILPGVLGTPYAEYSLLLHCIHWSVTCVLWGGSVVFLVKFAAKRYDFNIMQFTQSPSVGRWLFALGLAAICIIATTIVSDGFKPMVEYNGIIRFIFQTIYYLFESALITLTIIFGQKFGEMVTKKNNLPYGGAFLALTWGLVHILTQDLLTGVYAIVMALLYGIGYLVLEKNTRYAYILVAAIFIL